MSGGGKSGGAREQAGDLFGASSQTAPAGSAVDDHRHGHRARLRSRFMQGEGVGLHDYELLELLLFRSIPRRDVKPLAKRLLERFGDFAGVLAATPERLREIDGLGEAAVTDLKIIETAAQRRARHQAASREDMGNFDAVVAYCRVAIGRAPEEIFFVLFLDRKNKLIADERHGRGTVDQVAVYPREVAKRALELGASSVIMAHNHPSGDPRPSRADIDVTKRVAAALAAIEIKLLDHVVIGAASAESLAAHL